MLDTTGETIYFHWKINITRLLFCLFNTKQHFKMNYFWRTVRRVGGGGPVWALQWSECVCECVCVSSLQYLYWSMYQSEELHCSYCFMFLFCSAQVEVGGGGGGSWGEVGGEAYCFLFLLCEWMHIQYTDNVPALNYLSQLTIGSVFCSLVNRKRSRREETCETSWCVFVCLCHLWVRPATRHQPETIIEFIDPDRNNCSRERRRDGGRGHWEQHRAYL